MKDEALLPEENSMPKKRNSPSFLPDGYELPPCSTREKYEHEERGNRKHFIKPCITMSPTMLKDIKAVGAELQEFGEKDTDVSSFVRQACAEALIQAEERLGTLRYKKYIDSL